MTPRLHVDADLAQGAAVALGDDDARYLRSVLRLQEGASVLLFNGKDGEWLAVVESFTKRGATLVAEEHNRAQPQPSGAWLLMAAIKRPRLEWLLEKATELGAARITLLTTERSVVEPNRPDRLRAKLKEAAEQCGRLDLPALDGPAKLRAAVEEAAGGAGVLCADEARDGVPLHTALRRQPGAALLVGPEGGWSNDERGWLRETPGVTSVTLACNVLRAETAAIAALSVAAVVSLRER